MKRVPLSIGAFFLSLVFIWTFFSVAKGADIGEICTKDTDCTQLHPNSHCSKEVGNDNKICTCNPEYEPVGKKCAAPYQKDCKKDNICINDITNECKLIKYPNYLCVCKDNYEAVKDNCVGHLGSNCSKDEECPVYLSYCSNAGKCECQDGLKAIEDKCVSDYNNFCTITGGGCFTPNAECKVVDTSMRCLCPEKHEYSQEKGECISTGGGTIATYSAITVILICILNILSA